MLHEHYRIWGGSRRIQYPKGGNHQGSDAFRGSGRRAVIQSDVYWQG